ncbi:MAG: cytochrome c maturation protein CcmE [Candidatus Promineifilaceae bacterium]|nr:cytochrome c maturation protein CcmE [Candidatus Promineifilaceae bacterium]
MTDTSWTRDADTLLEPRTNRLKFVVGGILIAAALVFLIVNGMSGNTQLYKTVDEYYAEQSRLAGRDLRVAGMVLGESIKFTQIDATHSRLEFEIVDDLENPGQRLRVVAMNEPLPDLLQHEAQALVEGRMGDDGAFHANEGGLFLKCPTRYEEAKPPAAAASGGASHPAKGSTQ